MIRSARKRWGPSVGGVVLAALVAPWVAALSGCGVENRTYDLTVRNQSSKPVTLWLTKDGPPIEPGWKEPERVAQEAVAFDEKDPIAGVAVPPGKTATTGPRKGEFGPQTEAVLRVYVGALSMSEILATKSTDRVRKDVVLSRAGKQTWVVTDAPEGSVAIRQE